MVQLSLLIFGLQAEGQRTRAHCRKSTCFDNLESVLEAGFKESTASSASAAPSSAAAITLRDVGQHSKHHEHHEH